MQDTCGNQGLMERKQKFAPREVRSADEMWQLLSTDESFKPYKISRAGSDLIWRVHETYLQNRQIVDQAHKMYKDQWRTSGFSAKDKIFAYHIMQTTANRAHADVELLRSPEGYKNQKFLLWFFVAYGRNPDKPGRTAKARPVVKCQSACTCETAQQTTHRRRGRKPGSCNDPMKTAMSRELFRRRDNLPTTLLAQLARSKKCYWAEKALRSRLAKMSDSTLVETFIQQS